MQFIYKHFNEQQKVEKMVTNSVSITYTHTHISTAAAATSQYIHTLVSFHNNKLGHS